jgi:hypothetical protein
MAKKGRRGRDRMVVGFTITYASIAYHHLSCEFEPIHGEMYLIQHYVIKFVSDLRQVGGFFWVNSKIKFKKKDTMFVLRWSFLLHLPVIVIRCVCVFQFP